MTSLVSFILPICKESKQAHIGLRVTSWTFFRKGPILEKVSRVLLQRFFLTGALNLGICPVKTDRFSGSWIPTSDQRQTFYCSARSE
jgi:hypothetical protein